MSIMLKLKKYIKRTRNRRNDSRWTRGVVGFETVEKITDFERKLMEMSVESQ